MRMHLAMTKYSIISTSQKMETLTKESLELSVDSLRSKRKREGEKKSEGGGGGRKTEEGVW